jgi:S-adenosylmethionine-diacylglycerol 3-amino-3-carboxypropyl transferase
LPLIHSKRTIAELLEVRDHDDRHIFWKRWNNRRWRLLFQVFFSRRLMGWLGRDPEFFRYVEGDVAQRFMERAQHGLAKLPTHANPYLHYIVHGNFGPALPRYLRPENFKKVRSGLERLTLYHGAIEQAGKQHGAAGFDAFNLSDIFEYLDPDIARKTYCELTKVANPGARLAYWNTLVPRGCPEELADQVLPLRELSAELHERDLAFFYGAFHVDEVSNC